MTAPTLLAAAAAGLAAWSVAALPVTERAWRVLIVRLPPEVAAALRGRGGARSALVAAALGFAGAALLVGVVAGTVAAVLLPLTVRWLAGWRAGRRRRAMDAGAIELARALTAALAAGNSLHGALAAVAPSVPQPLAAEVDRAARRLALGYMIDDVLAELAARAQSDRVRTLGGALALQRRAGGDLVRLLDELRDGFRAHDRALGDARGAIAQARITALIVSAAPPLVTACVAVLAPRTVLAALTAPAALVVLGVGAALHTLGVVLALRIARVVG